MKKAFTLIELLISVTILAVLFIALSNVITYLSDSSLLIRKNFSLQQKKKLVFKVLYYDILNAESIHIIQKKNYSEIFLQTGNSLYGIPEPYVMWYVSKNKNSLIRLESPQPVNLTNLNNNYYLDKFAQNVKIFKIYQNDGKYFVYFDSKKPIYFEMYKGF